MTVAKKKAAKKKLDPNDPLTPVLLFLEEKAAMDEREVAVVKLAHARGVKAEALAAAMGVARRTIYNRLDGITPSGKKV